ncbi:hypothetical protein GGR51DRAFT_572643 [Nemania sp. FL0031]|nr:hypothetical protein GGR51DRAFT_572643 [Nemania sp. FL0031]
MPPAKLAMAFDSRNLDPVPMASRGTILYFKSLAIQATFLLWGIFLANGGVKVLLSAVWHQEFSDGIPLRTVYSGFPPLDFLISILVGFFYYGTDGHDEGYHAFLVAAYSALQPAFVWLYVEAARPGPKPYWVERPTVFGILWQCFGAAIALPLYFAIHLPWATSSRISPVHDDMQALAIPWSFLLGAVLPAE